MKTFIALIKNNKEFSIACLLSIINTLIYFKYPTKVGVYVASFLTGVMIGYLWYYKQEILKVITNRKYLD